MTHIPNETTNITISEIQAEIEVPFVAQNLKEFNEKKAKMLAFLREKLGLKEAQKAEYMAAEPNSYQKIKRYLSKHYDLKYDIVKDETFISPKGKNEWQILTEMRLVDELYENNFQKFNDKLAAVLQSGIVERYDSFVNYFFNLPEWTPDKPDYIGQLASYVQTTDNVLFAHHLKKHLIRAVACSLTAIDFNKQCLILYGRTQNAGKTSFLRFLSPGYKLGITHDNFIKEDIELDNKDGLFALAKYLYINLDEMQGFKPQEMDKVKSYMTKSKITARIIYQKKDSNLPRRASFVGTTNNESLLTDATGNIRFVMFEVLSINHDKGGKEGYEANIDINNVYAQAFYYFITGARKDYELSAEEIAALEEKNKQFMTISQEMDMLMKYFAPCSESKDGAEHLSTTDIGLVIKEKTGLVMRTNSLGSALRYYNFLRKSKNNVWGYYVNRNTY